MTEAKTKDEAGFWDDFAVAAGNVVLKVLRLQAQAGKLTGTPSVLTPELAQKWLDSRPDPDTIGGVAGTVAGSLPFTAAGGIPGAVIGGALLGASEGETPEDVATGAAIGGTIGAAAGLLGKFIGQIGRRATRPWNLRVLKASAPPGMAGRITKTGHDGVQQLQQAWDDAYSTLAPKLRVVVDDQLRAALDAIKAGMRAAGHTDDEIARVGNIIDGQVLGLGDEISGEAVQHVQSRLGSLARSRSELAEPLRQVRDAVLDAAERGSPEAAGELKALRGQYPAFLTVQRAAASGDAEGVFTPKNLQTAVRATDTSAGKARAAAGEAPHQAAIEEATQAGIGKRSVIERVPLGVGQFVREELATEPGVQAASRAVGAGLPKAAGPVTALTTDNGGQTAKPYVPRPYVPFDEGLPDDEFLAPYLNRNTPRSTEFDEFLAPYLREGRIDNIQRAIIGQESGGVHSRGGRITTSPQGALGVGQIMPSTFRLYALPGEDINNEADNLAVSRRIIERAYDEHGGDVRKVAAVYFSGRPDYLSSKTDATGTSVRQYVAGVENRMRRS